MAVQASPGKKFARPHLNRKKEKKKKKKKKKTGCRGLPAMAGSLK
jgi:hypothetical protein